MSSPHNSLVVQKYGGSSLATAERIRAAALRVSRTAQTGRPVIVVVSAMGDTTAVALACALGADRCDIYTDVEGIYTADPRVVPNARKLAEVGYEEMLELAQLGARVLHPRAVELGELYDMPIQVASSFADVPGTLIHRMLSTGETEMPMEIRRNVRGIAHDTDVARITLVRVPDRPGVAAAIFQPLAEANISVDTIAQSSGADGTTDLSFTILGGSLARALEITNTVAPRIKAA